MYIKYNRKNHLLWLLCSFALFLISCKIPYLDRIIEKKPIRYQITIEKTDGGEVTVSPKKEKYQKGEIVILTAVPDSEHRFSEWKGSTRAHENPYTLTVNGPMTILADFKAILKYQLVATAGSGGRIVSSVGEKRIFLEKEQCTLTAQADTGYQFVQWEGDASGTNDKLYLTFDKNYQVYARFKKATEYTLTATAGDGGKIVNSAGKTVFAPGEQCTLTAQADTGYQFVQWEGDASGTNDKLYLTFDKNYQIYARFKTVSDIYSVTVTQSGSGQIIRSSTKAKYAHNERLTLKAKAATGWIFKEWSGVSETQKYEKEIEVTVDTHKSINAEFIKRKWTYIMYLAADNELEGSALQAVNEAEATDIRGKDVSVLVLLDRHPGYDAADGNWSGTRLYELKYDKSGVNTTIICERLDCPILGLKKDAESELDMSSSYVLSGLLSYAKEKYQAEQYGLILWGHGSGWRGMLKDDTSGGTAMPIRSLRTVVKDQGLSIIGFDTGFAGNMEIMYELQGAAAYGIGSSGIGPAEGWKYRKIFEKYAASGRSAEEFCQAVIGAYKEQYSGTAGADITVCRLDKMGAVYSAYERLSKEVSEAITSREIAAKVKTILMRGSLTYRNSTYPSDVYVEMKDSTAALYNRAGEVSSDNEQVKRIKEAAERVMKEVEEGCFGWQEGSGERGHLGIYVHQMQSADAETGAHDGGYVKGSGIADQCALVRESEWWVVQPGRNKSVLDKVFYQYR